MKQERRKEIDELFEKNNILLSEVINYFSEEEIMENLFLSDDDLISLMDDPSAALDYIDIDTLREYVGQRNEYSTLTALKDIVREIKPKGYIDKEEAKRILSDYIDTWFDRAI